MADQLSEFSNEEGCPKCASKIVTKVKYTWWGGVLGPRMLHHTKCQTCGYTYNSKTRKPNTQGIVMYSVGMFVIVFAVIYFLNSR
jgi:transposase-like protein